MEKKKIHFTVDARGSAKWILIDTDESFLEKRKHKVCVSTDLFDVSYKASCTNLDFLSRDNLLKKPTIEEYLLLSYILKKGELIFNKNKCLLIEKGKTIQL